jgi:hypothetical protein
MRTNDLFDSLIDASLDDAAQRLKTKNEKREVKREKRETVRQQRHAQLRDEIMKRLETRPVKLHNIGKRLFYVYAK